MFRFVVIFAGLVLGSAVFAQEWSEPARGTQTRQDLMDAMRVHAEWQLGAPVQFVVEDLRVSGDLAYGSLRAQRPGGAPINLYETPAYARGTLSPEELDGAWYHALYKRSGRTWVAVQWSIGATDVWWAWGPTCRAFRPVIREFCIGIN